MVECGICLEEYQEGYLELHQQMCEVRLMFRCSLCDGDYVNKEGLWNHLELHEIADEIKELHYQEIKAKHKLHQCVLCNDQRAYSEISYWKHIHDVHDGFFLRCSNCGETFRSEKLKNDHASSRCKASYKHHSNVCDPVQKDSSSRNRTGEIILEDRSGPEVAVEKNHKLNCPMHDDSQFSTEDISLLHVVKEAQTNSTIVSLGENIDIKMEIEEEETLLQEQTFQVQNENPERSSATTLTSACLIDTGYAPVKSCSFEDAKLFVKNLDYGFGLQTQRISKKGNMRYYRCQRLKQNARPQCERKLMIFAPNTNEESTVYAKGLHSCINAPPENLAPLAQIDFGYAPVKTCSIEDAKFFVKNFEFGFSLRVKYDREKGYMRYYRCSRIKRRVRLQCERKVLICTPNKNEESTVCAKGEHSCMNAPPENLTHAQIDYAPVKTCSFEDAISFVKNFEFGFDFRSNKKCKNGRTKYYLCSRVKQNARLQCKRKVSIFTPNTDEESTVYAKGEHCCINAPPENLAPHVQIGYGYAPVKTCSIEDAKSFVKNFEFGFNLMVTNECEKGYKRYYRCSRIKRKARPQCERRVLICTPNENEESMVWAKGEHSCMNAPPENLMHA